MTAEGIPLTAAEGVLEGEGVQQHHHLGGTAEGGDPEVKAEGGDQEGTAEGGLEGEGAEGGGHEGVLLTAEEVLESEGALQPLHHVLTAGGGGPEVTVEGGDHEETSEGGGPTDPLQHQPHHPAGEESRRGEQKRRKL